MKKKFLTLILNSIILTTNPVWAMDDSEERNTVRIKIGMPQSELRFEEGKDQEVTIDWFVSLFNTYKPQEIRSATELTFDEILSANGGTAQPNHVSSIINIQEDNNKSGVLIDLCSEISQISKDSSSNSGHMKPPIFEQAYPDIKSTDANIILCKLLEHPISCTIAERSFILETKVSTLEQNESSHRFEITNLVELRRRSRRSLNMEYLKPEARFHFKWLQQENKFLATVIVKENHFNDLILDSEELKSEARQYMVTNTITQPAKENLDKYYRWINFTLIPQK